MLLDAEHVTQPAPETIWLEALDETAHVDTEMLKVDQANHIRRLRRMQSQNALQRAVHNIYELVTGHSEAA